MNFGSKLFPLVCKHAKKLTDGRRGRPHVRRTEASSGALQSIKGEITQKVLKRGLSFLYVTHRHDLFYITVTCHQNIPNGIQFIERTRKCLRTDVCTYGWTDSRRTDARLVVISPKTFRSGERNKTASDGPN